MMNFMSMEYFIIVVHYRNITRAAAHLHITQQTLSAHMSALEKELGCQLLIRRTPLRLTYEGEVFYRYASEIRQRYGEMHEEFADLIKMHRGLLNVGIAYMRGRAIMPSAIPLFQQRFPDMEVRLDERAADSYSTSLLDGELDLAIGQLDEHDPNLEILPFYQEEVIMAVPLHLCEAHSIRSAADVLTLPLIPYLPGEDNDSNGRIGRKYLKQHEMQVKVTARSHLAETTLQLCVGGCGICFCPRILANTVLSPQQKALLRLFSLDIDATYAVSFGLRRSTYHSEAVKGFIDSAREAVKLLQI